MKRIFQGQIYEVLPLPNGIIFSYCKEIIDEKVVVSFKMLSFETGRITDVAKNIYFVTKFGTNYRSILKLCGNYITVKAILLPNSKVFLLSPEGEAQIIDGDGTPIWNGSLSYRGFKASGVALYKNSLWTCYSDSNALVRYNLTSLREELRIGGHKSPFNAPRNLFVEDNTVMVINGGSQKLIQVNLDSYTILEREEFEEPLKQYIKVGKYRFVLLDSGIYML